MDIATGLGLVAEALQRLGGRADEGQARRGAPARELGAFAEEAIARMDGLRAGDNGKVEQSFTKSHEADQLARQIGAHAKN